MSNDDRIVDLLNEIEQKQKDMGKKPKFSPVTCCVLHIFGSDININVCNVNDLKLYASILMAIMREANENRYINYQSNDIFINHYPIEDWLTDIKQKISVYEYEENYKKLEQIKKQLNDLLSADKKTSFAVEELAKLI